MLVGRREHVPAGAARTHLGDGRVLLWDPLPAPAFGTVAVDAEISRQAVPPALARRFGVTAPGDFWPRWTATETVCKLLDEPVLVRLAREGLVRADAVTEAAAVGEVHLLTRRLGDLTVTFGLLRR